jgi:hypothetical protein
LPQTCPRCGAVVVGTERFCSNCGYALGPSLEPPPQREKTDAATKTARTVAAVAAAILVVILILVVIVLVVVALQLQRPSGPTIYVTDVTATPVQGGGCGVTFVLHNDALQGASVTTGYTKDGILLGETDRWWIPARSAQGLVHVFSFDCGTSRYGVHILDA